MRRGPDARSRRWRQRWHGTPARRGTPSRPITSRPWLRSQRGCHQGRTRKWAAQTRRPSWGSSPGRCSWRARPPTAPNPTPSSQLGFAPRAGSRTSDRVLPARLQDLRLRARLHHLDREGAKSHDQARYPEGSDTTYSRSMRPLRYSINVTLDGCCDHRAIIADEDLHRHAVENLDRADAILLGRVTYEMMEAAWRPPARTGWR